MLDRRARLIRIVSVMRLQKALSDAQAQRLQAEERRLDDAASRLVARLAEPCRGALGELAFQTLPKIMREASEAQAACRAHDAERQRAERRVRAGARVLAEIDGQIERDDLRRGLEELRFDMPSASSKFPRTKF